MTKLLKILFVLILLAGAVFAVVQYRPEVLDMVGLSQTMVENNENESVVGVPDEEELEVEKEEREWEEDVDLSYEARIKKGREYFQGGLLDFAAQEFAAAAEKRPDNPTAYSDLGRVQYRMENWEHAANNLYSAQLKGDNSLGTAYLLVRAHLQAGNIEEAKESFGEIDEENEGAEVLYMKGLFGILENNRSLAGGSFTELKEEYPEHELTRKAERYLEAYHEFDLFQDGHPVHLKALLAKALNKNGEYAISIELLKEAIREKSDYRDAWILFGYAYYAQEEYAAARNAWLEAVEIDPTKPESQYFLGLAYANLGYEEEAIEAFEFALENEFEPRLQALSKLAEVYLINKNYSEAAAAYEKYLAEGGDNVPDNYVRPIWIYLDHVGTPEALNDALKLANDVVSKFPESALAHNLRGWVLIYNEEYDEAIRELRRAKQYDPELAAVYLNFGLWHHRQDNLEEAKKYYNTAYQKGGGDAVSNTAAKRYNEILEQEEVEPEEKTEE